MNDDLGISGKARRHSCYCVWVYCAVSEGTLSGPSRVCWFWLPTTVAIPSFLGFWTVSFVTSGYVQRTPEQLNNCFVFFDNTPLLTAPISVHSFWQPHNNITCASLSSQGSQKFNTVWYLVNLHYYENKSFASCTIIKIKSKLWISITDVQKTNFSNDRIWLLVYRSHNPHTKTKSFFAIPKQRISLAFLAHPIIRWVCLQDSL